MILEDLANGKHIFDAEMGHSELIGLLIQTPPWYYMLILGCTHTWHYYLIAIYGTSNPVLQSSC